MRQKSYKEQIRFLAHLHKETIDKISSPSFYYFNPQWPEFIASTSEFYQQPVRKVVDDLVGYRNSFTFQKDRTYMLAILAAEREAA